MLRKFKEQEQKGANKALKEQFRAAKEKQIESGEEDTMVVQFKAYTGCGCGGSYDWYFADVPESEYDNFNQNRRWDIDDLPSYVTNIRRQ